jgi:hypothetical protein
MMVRQAVADPVGGTRVEPLLYGIGHLSPGQAHDGNGPGHEDPDDRFA